MLCSLVDNNSVVLVFILGWIYDYCLIALILHGISMGNACLLFQYITIHSPHSLSSGYLLKDLEQIVKMGGKKEIQD